jgi:hypothetical protein
MYIFDDGVKSGKAKLYCFDFDDNIVRTDSKVWTLDGPKTTAELASHHSGNGDVRLAEEAFREFSADRVDGCKITKPGNFESVEKISDFDPTRTCRCQQWQLEA